jgi:hypothetical protein
MSRWGKPIKNKKHKDPRYFLNESIELHEEFSKKSYINMLKAASSGRKDAQKLVWQQAEDIVAKGIKFNPHSEELMKIDKESIAKAYNLNPKTGEPLDKGEKDAISGMTSRLQQQRPDLQVSKDDGKTKKAQQKIPGVSVKPGKVKGNNSKGNVKMMLMNIRNMIVQKYKAKEIKRDKALDIFKQAKNIAADKLSFEEKMNQLDKLADSIESTGDKDE